MLMAMATTTLDSPSRRRPDDGLTFDTRTPQIGTRVPLATAQRLDEEAAAQGLTRSMYLRRLIEAALAE